MVERLFLTVLRGCLQFVIVVFTDHTHLLFLCFNDNIIFGEDLTPVKCIYQVTWAVVRSQAVTLFLLIYCLIYLQVSVGFLRLSLFCYVLRCVLSSFAIES